MPTPFGLDNNIELNEVQQVRVIEDVTDPTAWRQNFASLHDVTSDLYHDKLHLHESLFLWIESPSVIFKENKVIAYLHLGNSDAKRRRCT